MDYICTLFKNDPQFWSALISIVLCFCFRAYRLERDNIHYPSKEAGQRTLLAIAVMIILSLCLNSEQQIISAVSKEMPLRRGIWSVTFPEVVVRLRS